MDDFQMLPSCVTFIDNQLCYSGQKCQKIPEALIKLYGPKVQGLDLSYNELITLRGLEGFPLLRELVLDNNQLTDALIIPHLPHLHTLSLNKNNIHDIESLILQVRQNLPAVTYLSLLGNLACPNQLSNMENDEEDYQRYRYFVLHHLPNLRFLDSNRVRESERTEARRRGQFMKVVRPTTALASSNINDNDPRNNPISNSFTPLPKSIRSPEDYKASPVDVLVEHDYVAKESNELSIAKGDIIRDVVKKQGGWWEGILRDKKGLFPDNFGRVLDKESVVMRNRKDATRIRQCRVVFSYKQDHEDELNLNVGDVIDIIGEEEEGWWRGMLNGKEGVFPSNFVEEISSSSNHTQQPPPKIKSNSKENLHQSDPSKSVKAITCEVRFSYKAQNEDELTLKEGDIVTLVSTDAQDPGWWKGELNGVIGVFPDNFVTVINKPADDKPVTGAIKTTNPSSQQRKSQEFDEVGGSAGTKTTPPLPGKKPSVPLKKSPSGSGSGGLFSGFKKKIADVVDGATGSKISLSTGTKTESSSMERNNNINNNNNNNLEKGGEFDLDEVVRRPLLADVRATRPKAPGRRLPSVIVKEGDSGVMNGVMDHVTTTDPTVAEPVADVIDSGVTTVEEEKPKVREWNKNPVPWLAEMKLNQAKRTSTSPGPDTAKPKPIVSSPTNDSTAEEPTTTKISPISRMLKTPPHDGPVLRNKPHVPAPARPQTIHSAMGGGGDNLLARPSTGQYAKISPLAVPLKKTSSPLIDKSNERVGDLVQSEEDHQASVKKTPSPSIGGDHSSSSSSDQVKYQELLRRIGKLEEVVAKQERLIEELGGKLQLETELRRELQVKIDGFVVDGAIQQI